MAFLPSVALITARGFQRLRRSALRWALISLLVVWGLVEFFALSYDGLGWLRERAVLTTPLKFEINLLAQGQYIELPASGRTDPGYHVVPQILDQVMIDSVDGGREEVQLGLLVNDPYVNSLIIRYEMYDRYPGISLRRFETGVEEPPFYPKIFECDYLLVLSGSRELLTKDAYEAVAILESSPSLFHETFGLLAEYPMPNGDIAYLYRKRHYLRNEYDVEAYRELAGELASMAQEGDALIVEPPGQVEVIGAYYEGHVSIYPLPDGDSLDEGLAVQKLQDAMADHKRIFSVFGHRDQVDPQHFIEQWLNKHAFRAWEAWYGAVQLVLYGTLWEGDSPALERSVSASWAEQISLEGYRLLDDTVEAGDILRITLHWRALSRIDEDYKVFIHLLDEDGNLVAQRDSQPLVGAKPMTSWDEGEELQDNYGILVSDAVPAGHYSLIMGIYSASTGDRLMVSKYEDGTVLGDAISLTSVMVINEQS